MPRATDYSTDGGNTWAPVPRGVVITSIEVSRVAPFECPDWIGYELPPDALAALERPGALALRFDSGECWRADVGWITGNGPP
jgi:hypothetical protein